MISLPITINVLSDTDGNLSAELYHDPSLPLDQVVEVLHYAAGLLSRKRPEQAIEITNQEDLQINRRRLLYPDGTEHFIQDWTKGGGRG